MQGADKVLDYLGRYVHRTAIGDAAILACDDETAYAAGMQVLLDDVRLHGAPLQDGVADNAARAAAAALARWGDEAGAREVESAYGVTRIPPLAP